MKKGFLGEAQSGGIGSPSVQSAQAQSRLIVHVINGLERGGAETALFRLIVSSSKSESFHVVSLTDEGQYGPLLRTAGVPVTCLHMRAHIPSPLCLVRLVFLLTKLHPCVVQTWMSHSNLIGGVAARLAGVPVCWGIRQADLSSETNNARTRLTAKVSALLSNWIPSSIVSCSHHAASVHQAFGYARRFVVIPNGLDASEFVASQAMRQQARSSLGFSEDERIIGHVGRFDIHKDYPTLLASCGLLHKAGTDFTVILCGRQIEASNTRLISLIEQNSLAHRIRLLGPRKDIPMLLAAMDLLVMSSLSEAFPNVVAEAMAAGVPCVVTDVGDAADIVGDTGWIVPPRDPAAMAQAIAAALSLPSAARRALGRRARNRVETRYTIGAMVSSYNQVWRNAALGD